MSTQQSSGPLSLISCVSARETSPVSDGLESKNEKKKRFNPLRNLSRMFRRKNRQLDVADLTDACVLQDKNPRPLDPRSCSTGRLLDDDTASGRRRSSSLAPGLSLSHDSVFKPDRTDSGHSSSDLENSSLSIPILIPTPRFQAELADVIRRRVRGDDSDDEDLGLPRSRCSSLATDYPDKLGDRTGKSQSSCSEGSLLSTGSSFEDDLQADGETSDLDLKVTRHKLSHSAAKHKMAVRPRRNHNASSKRSLPKSGLSLPVTPEVNEEASTSWTAAATLVDPLPPSPEPTKSPSPPKPDSSKPPPPAVKPESLKMSPAIKHEPRNEEAQSPAKKVESRPEVVKVSSAVLKEGNSTLPLPKTLTKLDTPEVIPDKSEVDMPHSITVESINVHIKTEGNRTSLTLGTRTPLASLTSWSELTKSEEPKSLVSPYHTRPELWSKSASLPHGAALSSAEAKIARSLSNAAKAQEEKQITKVVEEIVEAKIKESKPKRPSLKSEGSTESLRKSSSDSNDILIVDPDDGKSVFRSLSSKEESSRPPISKSLSRTADRRQRVDPIDIPAGPQSLTRARVSHSTSPPTPTWPNSMTSVARSISPPKVIWPESKAETQTERTGLFIKNEGRSRKDSREAKPPIQKSHSFHKDVPAPVYNHRSSLPKTFVDDDTNRRLYMKNRNQTKSLVRKEEKDSQNVKLTKKSASLESIGVVDVNRNSHPARFAAGSVRSSSTDSIRSYIVTHEEPQYANLKNLVPEKFHQITHPYENIQIIEMVKKETETVRQNAAKPESLPKQKMVEPKAKPVVEVKEEIPKQVEKPVPEFMRVQLKEPNLVERRKSALQMPEETEPAKPIVRTLKKQNSLIEMGSPQREVEFRVKKQTSIQENGQYRETPARPKSAMHCRPGDNIVIVEKSAEKLGEEIILRRKSQSTDRDEPELMKVFARRSMKAKDEDKDVDESENGRSRDSDKENDVADSPKEERKKSEEVRAPVIPNKPAAPLKPSVLARNSGSVLNRFPRGLSENSNEDNKSMSDMKNKLNGSDKPVKVEKLAPLKKPTVTSVTIKEAAKEAKIEKVAEMEGKREEKEVSFEKEKGLEKMDGGEEVVDGPGFKTIQDRKAEWEKRLQAAKH